MSNWVMATEEPEPSASGRHVGANTVVHAYDADAGEGAHPITSSYVVRPHLPWRGAAPRPRCERCKVLVPRFGSPGPDDLAP